MEPMRAVMDAASDPLVAEVVLKKGTQVGYTELLLNLVGYFIDVEPCPILWLLPDQKAVEEISKNRLSPMLRDTPRLAGKVKAPRSRDSNNTIAGKSFPGGRLAMVGSHAPNDISSRPIRVVICDETDRYAISAGVDGDPMALAAKRQTWFWNRKTIKGSSPTVKGRSVIDRDYRLSDMRECHVGCPHCGEKQVLRWSQVRWDKDKDHNGKTVRHKPETAAYQCEHCGVLWDDQDRYDALSRVKAEDWIATAPFRGIAGFHYPQFLSTVVKLADVVTEFLTAYGRLPGTVPDVQKQKVWTNTVLAECWEEEGEVLEAEALAKRAEVYGPLDLPDGARFATAGVDTQGNRLEVQVLAWGFADECWAARYEIIDGDPAQLDVWRELDRILLEPLRTQSGNVVRIRAACVDAGGNHAAHVHAYCRPRHARRVYPIVGSAGPKLVWPKRSTRSKHGHVYTIGVDTAKDAVYGRLKIKPRGHDQVNPGFVHFPVPDEQTGTGGFGEGYFEQLTSERVLTKYKLGKPYRVWDLPPGKRNEALDTFGYAYAARMSLPIRLKAPGTALPDEPPKAAELPAASLPAAPANMPTRAPAAAAATVARPAQSPAAPRPAQSRGAAIAAMFRR